MTEFRSIDYPDIPEPAVCELEALLGHDDPENSIFALIAENEATFPASVLDRVTSLQTPRPDGMRVDILSEIFMDGAQHEQGRCEIFLRLESGVAFHLFCVQDWHYNAIALLGLNAYAGDQYDALVRHMKQLHLEDLLQKNLKMLMQGSAPLDYARIEGAFGRAIERIPELASQRDCDKIIDQLDVEKLSSAPAIRPAFSRRP